MTVESFDPNAIGGALDQTVVSDLLAAAANLDPTAPEAWDLDAAEAARLSFTATHSGWVDQVASLDDDALRRLIYLFTLAEQTVPGWQAGDKSPVIVMVRALKNRGTYSVELTRWIKAHTDNKFLPHGSLADLL